MAARAQEQVPARLGVGSRSAWLVVLNAETSIVGSSVLVDGPGGAADSGVVFVAGVSVDDAPAAGASGGDEGWVGVAGGVCAEARTLNAARTHNATAH